MKKGVTGEDMCAREEETERERAREREREKRERLQKYTQARVQTCQRANEPERVKS